jgi:hypothetical protein
MEVVHRFGTVEQARNAAVRWLETRGISFGPHRKVEIGRLGSFQGVEVGVRSTQQPFWRIRIDYDPTKGTHFNVEFGKSGKREKAAFTFSGSPKLVEKLRSQRAPR